MKTRKMKNQVKRAVRTAPNEKSGAEPDPAPDARQDLLMLHEFLADDVQHPLTRCNCESAWMP